MNSNGKVNTGAPAAAAVVVNELGKVFHQKGTGQQVTAIENLTFALETGSFVCVVGRTGCGKSTFFNILAGLERPSRGEILIGGKTPYDHFDAFKGKIGVIFQQDRLLPWRTALENVALGLEILGHDAASRRRAAEEWLVRLGLGDFLQAYPGELSGGMRQRVAMARAFALDPELLLVDEAFGHLDEVTARTLRTDFLDLARTRGTTVVMVTHQLDEAIEVGGRILIFGRPARLLADIRPAEALQHKSASDLRLEIQSIIDANVEVRTGVG